MPQVYENASKALEKLKMFAAKRTPGSKIWSMCISIMYDLECEIQGQE